MGTTNTNQPNLTTANMCILITKMHKSSCLTLKMTVTKQLLQQKMFRKLRTHQHVYISKQRQSAMILIQRHLMLYHHNGPTMCNGVVSNRNNDKTHTLCIQFKGLGSKQRASKYSKTDESLSLSLDLLFCDSTLKGNQFRCNATNTFASKDVDCNLNHSMCERVGGICTYKLN